MIKQACPKCGVEYTANKQITIFACCHVPSTKKSGEENTYIRKANRSPKSSIDRPGDAVYILIKRHFGVDPPKGCGCRRVQSNMNAKGWQECLASIDSLANELKANAEQFSWGVTMWAALQATMSGALRWLNPLDPWRSIIREACRLTKEACDEQAKEQQGNGG